MESENQNRTGILIVLSYYQQTSIIDLNMTPTMNLDPRVNASKSESLGDGNLTGKVGTALYVSPEMTDTSTRTHYNQVKHWGFLMIFIILCVFLSF